MRKIIVSTFVTLDGVMEDPGGAEKTAHGGWTQPYADSDFGAFKFAELAAADTLLLGRVTYQGFAVAWPQMTTIAGEYATMMNGYAKFVASTTLKGPLEWNNSRLIQGNIADEVSKLKHQSGKDILIFGSSGLIQTLMQHDLIDDYRLLIYPVVLGSGKHLFKNGRNTTLKLADSKVFGLGVVALTYRRGTEA